MRTITSDLVAYYEEDESLVDAVDRYYGQAEMVSEVDRMTTAIWAGSASVVKKLSKHVKREDLKSLTRGLIPDSAKGMAKGAVQRIRGKKPNAEDSERLAHDVALSAPKSVSMALHLEGDNRLFDAHMEAVLETFDLLEREYAQSRIQVNGVRSVVNTGNMIAALIPHHTSRDGDMQLHTHMLIMNGTEGPDGQWRSLSHEKLADAKWVGSFYRQKLAEKVQRLGYRIYETKHGFELEGYNRSDVEVFSKRHRAIVKAVMDEGLTVTPKNKKQKVLTTRKAKRGVGKKLEAIQDHWRVEAQFQAVGHPVLAEPLAVASDPDKAKIEVDSALRHFSQWSAAFEKDDIYSYVFRNIKSHGLSIEQVDQEIQQSKELIPVNRLGFTTVTAVEEGAKIHQLWMEGQGQAQPMIAVPELGDLELNADQAKAVLNTLVSRDRHQIWQGFAGVGKSRSLGALKQLLTGSGLVIRGFSPTIPAAKNLQDELGITTNTVENLVRSQPDSTLNQLWLIDEAAMKSRRQMLAVLMKADQVGARILFVGDVGQNSAIEAGNPFKFMVQNGATTHRIEEIVRQQDSVQKQAVEMIARGNGLNALQLLNANGYVNEFSGKGERTQAIADQFLALPIKEQEQTLIVAGTNSERLAIELKIRQGEKKAGRLGESSRIVQLASRHMSHEQKNRADWYHPGDYLRLLQDYKSTGLKRGQLYKVEKRDGQELIVSSYGGRLYRVNPAKFKDKEVYRAEEFEVAVGDKLRWTATLRDNNWINGQQLTVTALDGLNMTVTDREGRSQDVPLSQPLALDYDRVWTSYRSQSATKKRVIVSTTNDPTSSQQPFYVDISRQVEELTVFTQSFNKLEQWVQKSNAQENALDLIGETYGHQRTATSDHDRNDRHERTSATKPTVAQPKSRTDDRYLAAKSDIARRESRSEILYPGEAEYDPDGGQTRPERFYPGIQRGNGGQEALRHERVDQGTRQIDGQLEDENRGYQHLTDDDGRQGIGSRRGDHEGQKQASPSRPTQDGRSKQREPAPSDLANWVMQWSEENELSASGLDNHLLALAKDIDNLSQSLEFNSFNGLDELADLVMEDQFADALADNLAHISQSIDHIDQTIEQNLSQQRIRAIADAVTEWRTGQELAEAVAEIASIVAQSTEGLDRGILRLQAALEPAQSMDIQFPGMAELVEAVSEWQAEAEVTAAIGEVQNLVESMTAPEFPGLEEVAQSVLELNEEQGLTESGLVEQLVELTTQINELVEPQQMEFEGLDQLAELVVDLQQGEDLALVQPQIQAITRQIEAFNDRQPTYSFAGIQDLADAVIEWKAHESIALHLGDLNDLALRAQESLHEFPAMQQLAQEVQSMREIDALANGPVAEQLKDIAQTLAAKGVSTTPKPKKKNRPKEKPKKLKDQVFWQPDYTGVDRPGHIDERHWQEWVDSCVHPDVIAARLQSIEGEQVIERLLGAKIEDLATRRKDGSLKKVRSQFRTKPIQSLINDRSHPDVLSYQELADGGGWWCDSGVNPLSFETLGPDEKPTRSLYGTFKPNPKTARLDIDKTQKARRKDPNAPPRYRKYENPMGPKRELFERDMAFQPVPDHIAQKIFAKHGVVQTQEEKAKGFWYTVYKHPEIPIYRTEGDKKDAALVSQGRVVIGGQGVNIGYRAKDQKDNRLERRVLHPQLEVFAVPGREFRYAHDWDSEQSTAWNVRQEVVREAELIQERGCKLWRVAWSPEQGKGVDDLIANHGPIAFEKADRNAYPMEREIKMHYRGQYTQIKNRLSREEQQSSNDIAIYLEAMKDGDAMDGYRVISQSDAMRELKSNQTRKRYMKAVMDLTGPYLAAASINGDIQGFEKMLDRAKQPRKVIRVDRGRSRDLGRGSSSP